VVEPTQFEKNMQPSNCVENTSFENHHLEKLNVNFIGIYPDELTQLTPFNILAVTREVSEQPNTQASLIDQ